MGGRTDKMVRMLSCSVRSAGVSHHFITSLNCPVEALVKVRTLDEEVGFTPTLQLLYEPTVHLAADMFAVPETVLNERNVRCG